MRHLKIEFIGYRSITKPYQNIVAHGKTVLGNEQFQDPILRVEVDKKTWDEMFDLYESHIHGRGHPAVQEAWDQYLMVMHLCGNEKQTGTKKI